MLHLSDIRALPAAASFVAYCCYYRALYNLFEPLVEVLRPIPGPAYLPILVLFVGIGHEMKITLIFLASLFRSCSTPTAA